MRIVSLLAATAVLAAATPVFAQDQPTEEARMAAFKANDKNKDGKLDKAEYKGVLEGLGFADQLDMLWDLRDVNKDGFITADEYKSPIAQ